VSANTAHVIWLVGQTSPIYCHDLPGNKASTKLYCLTENRWENIVSLHSPLLNPGCPTVMTSMSSSLQGMGEGLVWLTGMVVCLLAANRKSNCSFRRAMDGCIVCCGIMLMQIRCHLQYCKALLS